MDTKSVSRLNNTPALEDLNAGQRKHIMKNAFSCKTLHGRYVAIIDDVVTTGASAGALADCLYSQGASQVDLWVAARTPGPSEK